MIRIIDIANTHLAWQSGLWYAGTVNAGEKWCTAPAFCYENPSKDNTNGDK